jgi:uncharacterized Zn finger protein (UPF0148 family)
MERITKCPECGAKLVWDVEWFVCPECGDFQREPVEGECSKCGEPEVIEDEGDVWCAACGEALSERPSASDIAAERGDREYHILADDNLI